MADPSPPDQPQPASQPQTSRAKELEEYHESHPQSPSVKYAKFTHVIREHVREAAGERERRERTIVHKTKYFRREHQTEQES
jgi:hypothetical protein